MVTGNLAFRVGDDEVISVGQRSDSNRRLVQLKNLAAPIAVNELQQATTFSEQIETDNDDEYNGGNQRRHLQPPQKSFCAQPRFNLLLPIAELCIRGIDFQRIV